MIPILKIRRSRDSGVTGASWLRITGNPIVCSTVSLGQQPKKSRRLSICPLRRVVSQTVSNAASTSMPWHYHVNVTYVLRGSVYLFLCDCVSPYTAWIPETFAVDFALGCTSKELWTCLTLCYVLLCFSTGCFAHDRHVQVSICQIGVYLRSMKTSTNGNIFRVTGLVCGEFTGHRWIPCTKASDAELWCFLSSPEPTAEQAMETLVIWDATALIMTSL